jgi:subtilase family serine protease
MASLRRVPILTGSRLFSSFSIRRFFNLLFHAIAPCVALLALLCGSASAAAQSTAVQTLHGHIRQSVKDHTAAYRGPLDDAEALRFTVILPLRNQAELDALLKRLYDPSSPDYRHFLSVEEFSQRFGPTEDDYQAVAAYLRSFGLEPDAKPANRLIVAAKGTAAQVDAAFNVQMSLYQHPTENRNFYSPDREPSLKLSVPVAHIAGLDNFSLPRPLSIQNPAAATPLAVNGSGPGGSYLGSDMRAAYYGGTTLDGTGQVVGLLEYGGYDPADVTLSFTGAGQTSNVPVNNVVVDGTGAIISNYGDGEQVLDIVQAIGMAPALSQVRVYIGVGNDDARILNSMVTENLAKQIGCSWSWLPVDPSAADVFFQEMSAQGQSFLTASGDSGAFYSPLSPYFYPAEDQFVTAVGGTHLTTTGPGGSWVSETVWNSSGDGSGGGISPDGITLPSYQTGLATSANGGSTTLRNVPDVAMEGDFDNFSCQAGTCSNGWAGTSFAAPRWAGFIALVNQQAVEAGNAPAGGIGFLNPQLYQLAEGSSAANDFHDIVSGNNDTSNQPVWFSAVAGYDLTTGWGSATGQSLINDLAGQQVPGFWMSSTLSTVGLNPGSSTSDTIRVTDAGGFTSAVTLAVTSTLPSGVTASFAPNPSTGNAVLTLTADSTATQQSVPVTVQGTSGSLSQSTTFTLAIHTPSFSLAPSYPSLVVDQGASNATTVTVTPLYGFTGSVNLSVTGLPAGTTALFGSPTTSSTSTLAFNVGSSTVPGNYPLTITGVSGSLTKSTSLTLVVLGPTFALSGPSTVSLGQGKTLSSYMDVIDENGFTGSVYLSATNVPSGVTVTFSPNPVTGYASMNLAASASATPGVTTITVIGTSGSLTVSTTLVLDIVVPTFSLTTNSTLSLPIGGSTSTYVSVIGQYGFSASVTLSVTGLPAGVTAVWGGNPTTSSSTLYLYSSSSVTPGQYPVVVTGVSGSQSASSNVTLSVNAPSFTLSASGPLAIGQGTSASTYLYVNAQNGFAGTVNLSASGLPSGMTVTFSPASTTYYSSVSFQASASVPTGQYTVTITGTSGTLTASTTLTININTPTFTVSAYNLTVGAGYSGTSSVYVSDQYGFTGSVSLSVSGLPSGVTASFSPTSTTYSSTLTLTVGSAVPTGNYTLTVTGVSGSKTVSSTFVLNVAAAGFSLYGSSGLTVGQGSTNNAFVEINATNGFNGSVALSVAGLPSGVTGYFSPNPTATSTYSYLYLTVASNVATGSYPLTVTGTSGSLTSSYTVTLTVVAPTFQLDTPYFSTLAPGTSASSYASIYAQNGFSAPVTLGNLCTSSESTG